jgi:hypothetical protein
MPSKNLGVNWSYLMRQGKATSQYACWNFGFSGNYTTLTAALFLQTTDQQVQNKHE